MEEVKELTRFYEAIREDNRIGPTHISLYMAIFQVYNLNGFENPIHASRESLMKSSKINGLATYHKCIRGLAEFGYIRYYPSFDSAKLSQIILINE